MRILYKKLRCKRFFILIGLIFLFVCISNLEFSTLKFGNEGKGDRIIFKNKLEDAKVSGRIIISGNWTAAKAVGICTGSGTFSDPYVIRDLVIDGKGSGNGISIVNSKKIFFRIENVTIFNSWIGIQLLRSCNATLLNNKISNSSNGIYIDGWTDKRIFTEEEFLTFYAMNNTVSNNSVYDNGQYGIKMRYSDNNTITENVISRNYYGMYITQFSDNNTITDNLLKQNDLHGIFLEHGGDNIIKGNRMESSGFYSYREAFILNQIDSTNLVNNGHLYFYASMTNLSENDFLNAGQIYLINITNSIISNLDLSDGSVSISLFDCNNLEISYNNLSSNSLWGIYLEDSEKISIIGNIINENNEGISSFNLNNSTILENEINKNPWNGIYINGNNNLIARNNIKNNGYRGLEIKFFCENNTIFDNNIENNYIGIFLINSFSNISENVISGNMDVGLYQGGGSYNNTIFLNFFRNNGLHVSGDKLSQNWNNSVIGNYWDNYTGFDTDGDGIGEIPHIITQSPLVLDYLPIVDNNPPEITIFSPSNNSVSGSTALSFIISVKDKYLDEMWYTIDGGIHNYTFMENGTINQAAWNAQTEGQISLRFYAIDKVGNIESAEVIVTKKIPRDQIIPGFNLLFIFGIIPIICIKLIKIKKDQ